MTAGPPPAGPAVAPGTPSLANPYRPRVRRRWLHQVLAYRAPLARARDALLALQEAPHAPDARPLLVAAWDRIPFWRGRMRRAGLTRADLARPDALLALPPLSRGEVASHVEDIVDPALPASERRDLYRGVTSGSTGEPLAFYASGYAFLWFWAFVDFVLAWRRCEGRPIRPLSHGVTLLCALGHSPAYADWTPLFHGAIFRKRHTRDPDLAGALERDAPAVVTGDPDSLAALLSTRHRPRLVLSSAFAMPPDLHAALEGHLGCPVVEYWSAAETGPLGVACPAGRGYHVLTPAALVEATPATQPLPHANVATTATELLVTNLRNRAFPLIRYRLGDLGTLAPPSGGDPSAACACGLHAPLVPALLGRTATLFTAASGARFDPGVVGPLLARADVRAYHLAEVAPGRYRLTYEAPQPLSEGALATIAARLAERFGAPVTLDPIVGGVPPREPGRKPVVFAPCARPG